MHKLWRHLHQALTQGVARAKFLAKIAGECIAMTKAMLPAKLLLRNIYHTLSTKTSWHDVLLLDKDCIADLQWWLSATRGWNGAPLKIARPSIQLETDASGTGWGGTMMGMNASGTWTKDVSFQPSNYRELLAIYKSILSFRENFRRGTHLQILSDNITAVAYVNKLGGSSKPMTDIMKSIFTLTHELGISVSAKFLKGKLNVRADWLSRILSPYEWQLHPEVFRMLDRMWGQHTIDRFASEMMSQLIRYNSLYADPGSEAVDAMAQDWGV